MKVALVRSVVTLRVHIEVIKMAKFPGFEYKRVYCDPWKCCINCQTRFWDGSEIFDFCIWCYHLGAYSLIHGE